MKHNKTIVFVKTFIRGVATLLILPLLAIYWLQALFIGCDRALEYATEAMASLPGLSGRYLRRALLARILPQCDPDCEIGYGTIFSKADARVAKNVYIGPRCHIGLADIERNVLIAAGVHITSGARMHGIANTDIPIREQEGIQTLVRIGAGAWIGSGAIVMADVGTNSIVGAGAVVTRAIPDNVVAVGVPATIARSRTADGLLLQE